MKKPDDWTQFKWIALNVIGWCILMAIALFTVQLLRSCSQ
jgi:hypothetical protein